MDARETLYEWSKCLTEERVDEDEASVVVGQGRQAHEQSSFNCTVRGRREGVPVVVTYHSYFAEQRGRGGRMHRGVLEAFVVSRGLQIEGELARFTGWQRFVRRLRRPPPAPHPLLDEFRLGFDGSAASREQLSRTPFLDGALAVMRRPSCWRMQFERGTGLTTFDDLGNVVPSVLTVDVFVATNIDLLVRLGL